MSATFQAAVYFVMGAGSAIGLQGVFLLARRILRGASAAQTAEAFRMAAEKRASAAEDRLRLAELEIARGGGRVEPEKKVQVRQVR